jgi:hypothetical protein
MKISKKITKRNLNNAISTNKHHVERTHTFFYYLTNYLIFIGFTIFYIYIYNLPYHPFV